MKRFIWSCAQVVLLVLAAMFVMLLSFLGVAFAGLGDFGAVWLVIGFACLACAAALYFDRIRPALKKENSENKE